MYYLLVAVVGIIVGFVVGFFVMRNNPKYFGIDKMLKAKRDELIPLGKAKLEELKKKIDEALKQ